jgi:flap endonuclease-1
MGIKNLHKFLRGKCPEVFREIHVSELQYTKAIVDFSLYIFKYITIFGPDNWMGAMINLISCLRRNEVHAVFAFDGQAPEEKEQERQDRREKRDKLDEKISALEAAFQKAKLSGEIDPILLALVAGDDTGSKRQRLLGPAIVKKSVDLKQIEYEINRIKRQSVKLTPKDFENAKKVFDMLGIPYFQAPMEGESLCSDLCIRKKVDYVITEDSDVFAYGCPVLISKINTAMDTCVCIKLEEILEKLELNQDEFLDFCIMCGTDYNKNMPGIAAEKAFKLIKQHRTIEQVAHATKMDVSVLKHVRVREIFKQHKPFETEIPFCKPADFPTFERFVAENNIHISVAKLKKDFEPPVMLFSDNE